VTGKGGVPLIGLLIAGGMVGTRYLKVNLSPSVPVGLYWLRSVPSTLDRGMLVVLPVPESVRPIHGSIPLLKPIAGLPGDVVCVFLRRLFVHTEDWVNYGHVHPSWKGQPLPQAMDDDACRIVPEGAVFLASPALNSSDSRYYGPVAIAGLTARAIPLLTW
jgi:type IV secretory pathway protease TraF